MLATLATRIRAIAAHQVLSFARAAGSATVRQNLRSLARFVRPCRVTRSDIVTAVTVTMSAATIEAFTVEVSPPVVIVAPECSAIADVAEPEVRSGFLPATKTHRVRSWSFIASADRTQPSMGTLTITQGNRDTENYAIDHIDGDVLFAKLSDEADVYAVRSDRAGNPMACNCRGFSRMKHCKHVDATKQLKAVGILAAR
jgi:hypothetical protein